MASTADDFRESVFANSMDAVLLTAPDGSILRANAAAEEMFEMTAAELCAGGRAAIVDMTDERLGPLIERRRQHGRARGEIRFKRKDGTRFPGEVSSAIFDTKDGPRSSMIIRDMTATRAMESLLRRSLHEKETLLKEIHHRVKNNLQVISSLLRLQADQITDPATRDVFRDSQARVRSIALLHEKLYQSEDLAHVEMHDYLRDLTRTLLRTYGAAASHVRLEVEATGVSLKLDAALPCGLIINELVTNALKHAFGEHDEPGRVTVRLTRTGDAIELSVGDDGKGLPAGLDLETGPTLGVRLVMTLARQLEGSVQFDRAPGTHCTVRFRTEED